MERSLKKSQQLESAGARQNRVRVVQSLLPDHRAFERVYMKDTGWR